MLDSGDSARLVIIGFFGVALAAGFALGWIAGRLSAGRRRSVRMEAIAPDANVSPRAESTSPARVLGPATSSDRSAPYSQDVAEEVCGFGELEEARIAEVARVLGFGKQTVPDDDGVWRAADPGHPSYVERWKTNTRSSPGGVAVSCAEPARGRGEGGEGRIGGEGLHARRPPQEQHFVPCFRLASNLSMRRARGSTLAACFAHTYCPPSSWRQLPQHFGRRALFVTRRVSLRPTLLRWLLM